MYSNKIFENFHSTDKNIIFNTEITVTVTDEGEYSTPSPEAASGLEAGN